VVIGLAVAMAATTAFGQGVVTDIKTRPMADSDTTTIDLAIHMEGDVNWNYGWAGARVQIHILDATEVDVDGITPTLSDGVQHPTIPDPFGPRSANSESVAKMFTVVHSGAWASGIDITGSVNQPVMDLDLHAKNTDPANNSDVDITLKFWNIWHVRQGYSSDTVSLEPSDYIWVTSNIQDIEQLHTAQSEYRWPYEKPRLDDPAAHWLHVPFPVIFHQTASQYSNYFATFLNTATIGIEHVPEPTGAFLMIGGIGALAMCRRSRRRRLAS